jgi:paraquat-inducible protein A
VHACCLRIRFFHGRKCCRLPADGAGYSPGLCQAAAALMTARMPDVDQPKQEDIWLGWHARKRLVQLMLAIAALCSSAALCVPFMHLSLVGSGTEAYGLIRSIQLLWESGLYALAVLVVGFSVCFPFAKLAVLLWCTRRGPAGARARWLRVVGTLGKWSMLDAMLVAILLGLTRGQWLVTAVPDIGIPIFVIGILLNMLAGNLVEGAWRPVREKAAPIASPAIGGIWTWSLLILAGLALAGAQFLPTVQIDSFWLRSHSFSLLDLTQSLRQAGSWSLWLLMIVGCFILPWLGWLAHLWLLRATDMSRAHALICRLAHWSMIDVFAFALAIFLLEGRQFIPTALGPGAFLIMAALGLHIAARLVLDRLIARRGA